MSGFTHLKRNLQEDDVKNLFDKRQRNELSKTVQRFHENAYNAQIKLIVELERNLQKKVMKQLNISRKEIKDVDLLSIIKNENFKKDIKKDIDWLFTLHYKLPDRKLRKGLNHDEDIIEHMVEDEDPLEGLYKPSSDKEIVLYLYSLLMTPEIIENDKHQPVGDYNNNLGLDPKILGIEGEIEENKLEEYLFNKEIKEINDKSEVTTGGKRKSRKLKKSKKKTIKRKSTKRKSKKH